MKRRSFIKILLAVPFLSFLKIEKTKNIYQAPILNSLLHPNCKCYVCSTIARANPVYRCEIIIIDDPYVLVHAQEDSKPEQKKKLISFYNKKLFKHRKDDIYYNNENRGDN